MNPRVSVLIPAYNAAATLAETLSSVLRQRETRFECVLVDDGSSDDTAAIARDFARRDARIRLLAEPHRGLIATLNRGLEACRGELVARMDADDLMHGERLQAQLAALEQTPELAGVGCHVRLFPRRGMTPGLRHYEAWLNGMRSAEDVAREAFIECPLAHPTFMFRRPLMQRYAYRDKPWPEDYDLVLRLLTDGHRLGVVPRRLLLWRDHSSRLSRNDKRYAIARFTDCRAHFLAASVLAERQDYVLWGYECTGKALRKSLAGYGKQPRAIVELHPRRIGQTIFAAPVIHPDDLPPYRGTPILVSVAGAGPRRLIREALAAMAFQEQRDFVVCA